MSSGGVCFSSTEAQRRPEAAQTVHVGRDRARVGSHRPRRRRVSARSRRRRCVRAPILGSRLARASRVRCARRQLADICPHFRICALLHRAPAAQPADCRRRHLRELDLGRGGLRNRPASARGSRSSVVARGRTRVGSHACSARLLCLGHVFGSGPRIHRARRRARVSRRITFTLWTGLNASAHFLAVANGRSDSVDGRRDRLDRRDQ